MSGTTAVLLATPGGPLDPVWRLRPSAREELAPLGTWGVLLMATVSLACIGAAVGLWSLLFIRFLFGAPASPRYCW